MKAKIMFLAVASALADMAAAQALPTGGSVTAGSATIGTSGSAMAVSQTSQRAIIDWSTFNIGNGASVHFTQPNASAIAVNRVGVGGGASAINGTLGANGQVMILNPNGVMFGATAVVNVAGLIASTGNINDAQFMGGGLFAITGATTGSVSNQGSITISDAGLAAFVAPSVSNSGHIVATSGRITLASAQAATVSFNGGLYEIAVDQGIAGGSIANSGTLNAAGGTIVLSALDAANVVSGAINLSGIQQANRIEVHGGQVTLSSDLDATTVAGTSRLINVCDCAEIQDAVDIAKSGTAPGNGATVNVDGGNRAEQVRLDKAYLTLTGHNNATVTIGAGQTAFDIRADGVTVEDMKIVGPYNQSYALVNWNAEPNITAGFTIQPGVQGATIRDNDIRNVRAGVLMLGAAPSATITGNLIDNTKGSVLVRSDGATISGNRFDAFGNEWDIVFLNGVSDGAYFTSPHTSQLQYGAGVMAMSAANNGMHILDRRYGSNGLLGSTPQFGNRSHVVVSAGSSFTALDDFNLGNGLGNPRQPLGSIATGIGAAVWGGIVNVRPGTYAESVTIRKGLTLAGAGMGQTIIDPVGSNLDGIIVQDNIGADAAVTIKDLTVQGARSGIRVADNVNLGTITLDGVVVRDNASQGFISSNGSSNPSTVSNINIRNSVFEGNGVGNGSADINLFRFNGKATLENVDILGTRSTDVNSATDYGVQIRGHGEVSNMTAAGEVLLDNVRIAGTYKKAHLAVQRYDGAAGIVMDGVVLGGVLLNVSTGDGAVGVDASRAGWGAFFSSDMRGGLSFGNTTFAGGTFDFGDIRIGGETAGLRLDASQAEFSEITRTHSAAGAENFVIEDRVVHALDHGGIGGLVTWQAGNLYVTQQSGSIQRGVDAASAGAAVNVGAGTYVEQLTISKDLTLAGAAALTTIVQSPGSLTPDASGVRSILTIGGGADVEVSGFTFKGLIPAPGIDAGIFVRDGSHAHIHDNRVVDIRDDRPDGMLSGVQHGIGIWVGRATLGQTGSALIENNLITGYQKGGIVVDGPGSQASITGNTIIGAGPTDKIAQNGIQASRGASATISDNTVSGNNYTPASDEATGILIFTPGFYLGQGAISVGPNNVSGNEVGVWTNDPATLTSISLSGVTGNERNGVADFGGGFATSDQFLKYPAWAPSSSAFVSAGAFSSAQAGDMFVAGGAMRVSGWNGFAAIQPAVDAVTLGGSVNVAAGTYAENVVVNQQRNLTFDGATLQSFTLNASGSGIGGSASASGAGGFVFNAPVVLLSDTSLSTGGANIVFNGDVQNAGATAFALNLSAGSGDVLMVSGGSAANPLGHLDVAANNFSLAGTMWVSGYDIDAAGSVALSTSTLRSVGTSNVGSISAVGDITGSTVTEGAVDIQSDSSVLMTNIISSGPVTIEAANAVAANIETPTELVISSGGPVDITGSAPIVVLDAPSGDLSGSFGDVTNAGSGVIAVNGKAEVPQTLASSYDPSRVVPPETSGNAAPVAASEDDSVAFSTSEEERRATRIVRAAPQEAKSALDSGLGVELDLSPRNVR